MSDIYGIETGQVNFASQLKKSDPVVTRMQQVYLFW